jgi:ABC-type multidrug transport system fused ATPase/permease subunit
MPDRNTIKGNIEFKNVKFKYLNDKKFILDGLNLSIEAGKNVAIVGESGCGKTSTVNLIERLYEPLEGEILLDGINIKEYNLEYLRNLIGFVKQDNFLFNQSIKKNIIFGRENSIQNLGDIDEIVEKACRDVSIKDFIEKKPDKYEYNVGIKGSKLLPGHKQLISIARAILDQPKIIIFDEAITHLDQESKQQILKVLDVLKQQNITVIIIGYTYDILKNVDMIYVLKDGKIVEKGNHIELMSKNGYYVSLIQSHGKDDFFEEESINEKKRIKTMRNFTRRFTTSKTLIRDFNSEEEDEIKFQICQFFN